MLWIPGACRSSGSKQPWQEVPGLGFWVWGCSRQIFAISAEPGTSPGTTGRRWKWVRPVAAGHRTARPVVMMAFLVQMM